jgi:DNA-binding NtrC family response regulator
MSRHTPGRARELDHGDAGGLPVPPKRILLVEDDAPVRRTIGDLLRSQGYDVNEAANGRLTLSRLRQRAFELIISDVRMPELGARGLYEQVGYFQRDLLDRFIVITGWHDADTEFFETKTGVPVFWKPLVLAHLSEAIHRVLERGPRTESAAPQP